jgi:DNA repair exonuclease SbcCD ATPase subunit
MGKGNSYNDLIFQLGDLARERLPNKPSCPPSMQRVYRAEDALVGRQDELAALEQQMNDEDAAWQEYQGALADERAKLGQVVKRYHRAVEAIEGRVRELRKKLATRKADHRYGAGSIKKEEAKLADLEMTVDDAQKLAIAKDNMKKLRLAHMRQGRELEDMEAELEHALTPKPGQPGADGILAHKRLLELEDEEEVRKEEFDALMAELDQAIAEKEQEVLAAEDYLDQALFLLGEECYAQRIADPALAALYPRIDRAK